MKSTVKLDENDRVRALGLSIAQAVTGAYFVVAGLLTLANVPLMHGAFARWGWPAGAQFAIGALQLVGGTAVIVPRFARAAAWTLLGLMAFDMIVRVAHLELFPGLLEPLIIAPMLVVVANAYSPARHGVSLLTRAKSLPHRI